MSKQEFLEILRKKLTGRLSASEVEENVRYYDTYIDQAGASGKGVDEVLEELGDPDLIARTILDARGVGGNDRVYTASESRSTEDDGVGQTHTTWKVRQISGWKVWLVLILVLVVILAVVVPVFVWVVKLVVPVVLVLAALVFIRDHFGSGRS